MQHAQLSSARRLTNPQFLFAVLVSFIMVIGAASARTWTSQNGKTLKGKYVGLEDGNVLIERDKDGKTTSIALEKFSDKDRRYVEKRVEKEEMAQATVEDADAAESDSETAGEGSPWSKIAGMLAMGAGALIVSLIVGFLILTVVWAIFVHFASRMVGVQDSFGVACIAVMFMIAISIGLSLLTWPVKLAVSGTSGAAIMGTISFLLSLFISPLGIKAAYKENYVSCFLIYILSFFLVFVTFLLFGCGLFALAMAFAS